MCPIRISCLHNTLQYIAFAEKPPCGLHAPVLGYPPLGRRPSPAPVRAHGTTRKLKLQKALSAAAARAQGSIFASCRQAETRLWTTCGGKEAKQKLIASPRLSYTA